jgi:hypothetical protein
MTGTELPTGDELVPHLDGYDDDLLAAYVRGLLEHFEMKPAGLDPYQSQTLVDFAELMVQDVIVAAQNGNHSPLIQFAYRGIVDVAKDVWLEARESGIETNDSDDIGDAILFALRGAIDADQAEQGEEEPTERDHGRLYGLLSRFWRRGRVIPSPSDSRIVRAPESGVDYLDPEALPSREGEGS